MQRSGIVGGKGEGGRLHASSQRSGRIRQGLASLTYVPKEFYRQLVNSVIVSFASVARSIAAVVVKKGGEGGK